MPEKVRGDETVVAITLPCAFEDKSAETSPERASAVVVAALATKLVAVRLVELKFVVVAEVPVASAKSKAEK